MVERVEFPNRRGQRLVGDFHGTAERVGVIICHGMLSNRSSPKHEAMAVAFAEQSIPALRFDFAGRGESEGRLEDLSYSSEVEDLYAAIEWCASMGIERIGLFGSSMGGTVALLGAARDERVVSVATLAAVAHPEAIGERYPKEVEAWESQGFVDTEAGRLNRDFYDDCFEHNVIASVRVLRAPVLVIHGADDEVVPTSDGHDIACAARTSSFVIMDEADHRLSRREHRAEMIDMVVEFHARQLFLG